MEKIKNLKVNMEAKILAASNVVIVPHNGIDFDAIGSAVGLSSIVRKLKKQPIIVVDDPIYKMDHGVGLVIEDAKKETIILTREKYLQAKDDKDLYIIDGIRHKVTQEMLAKELRMSQPAINKRISKITNKNCIFFIKYCVLSNFYCYFD